MTERQKDILTFGALLAVLLLLFGKILFTDKIIRAPDITAEFFYTISWLKNAHLWDIFFVQLRPNWDIFINSGTTDAGSNVSLNFLIYRSLIFHFLPLPANIAWFIVFHLFFAATGTYLCCRVVGCSRPAALLGGLVFAVAPEIASLINAGHVQKIATISFAPWAFYFLERGFRTRRLVHFLATGVVLALQFFNMHWQIAFYTCLGVGAYGVVRSVLIILGEKEARSRTFVRLFGLNLATLCFFLSTVAISLLPVSDWAKETTRGVRSGANQGQGGLNVEEAMSWSLPPEELLTFAVPGFFGYSREEGAYNGTSIDAYYWGRMVFTQTTDYMGLLPWLLLPLPLLFRRDRYTWLAFAAVVGGILFSLGKYTPFYWFLYDYFPGINHFRVPKMMMFIPLLGVAVLAARGLDLLLSPEVRETPTFRGYLAGLWILPAALLLLLLSEYAGKEWWLQLLADPISQATRTAAGGELVPQRWDNLVRETWLAIAVAAVHAGALLTFSRWKPKTLLPLVLVLLYLADTGRINHKYMLLQPMPHREEEVKTPLLDWLARQPKEFRTLPMNGSDPMRYVSRGIPVFFTSNAVQMQRWQNFLDTFTFSGGMPDMMNLRYLVYGGNQLDQAARELGTKFAPVYHAPTGEVVMENRQVLPKAWLVPSVVVETDPLRVLQAVADPRFDPRAVAVVEAPSPLPVAGAGRPGEARVVRYEANSIVIDAATTANTLLVMGEKYAKGWHATVDGRMTDIVPVNYILRGVYLPPGRHTVAFVFDPLPFKIGKILTVTSLVVFLLFLVREYLLRRRPAGGSGE